MSGEVPSLEPIRRLLLRAATDPHGAADELEAMAARLMEAARRLRARGADGMRSPGGAVDRARIRVVGPDGVVKQEADTGGDWS